MKIGKTMNKFTDTAAPGVALVGLALAPFTAGTSFILALQAIGTSKMISYGVDYIEDAFSSKK